MIGGLLKSSSRLAMMAAAGILVGGVTMSSAKAADLGGDCCADLEERVAELEATTARKGNRKVNLTISGQVNRAIYHFNDGSMSRTVAGVENRVDSTRFIFTGSAKVTPRVTAGFEMNIELGLGATTNNISQASLTGPSLAGVGAGTVNVDGSWGGDGAVAFRTANWFLEDKDLGRVTVGRINSGGPVTTIDLGGINSGATARPTLIGNGLLFRNSVTGGMSGFSVTSATGACFGCNRMEGISWDSQSLHGFLLRTAWGEDGIATASVRYAGEFYGFQIAAGLGIEKSWQNVNTQRDNSLATGQVAPAAGPPASTTVVGALTVQSTGTFANNEYAGSLAFKHVASGIFAQGHYAQSIFEADNNAAFAKGGTNAATFWMVQGGVAKNWFGMGDTAIYVEYGKGENNTLHNLSTNPGALGGVVLSSGRMIGAGINQKVDAAAMEFYLSWHRFSLDVDQAQALANSNATAFSGAGGPLNNVGDLKDIDLVMAGARIRF